MGDRWRNRRALQSTQSRHLGSSRYLQSSSLALPPQPATIQHGQGNMQRACPLIQPAKLRDLHTHTPAGPSCPSPARQARNEHITARQRSSANRAARSVTRTPPLSHCGTGPARVLHTQIAHYCHCTFYAATPGGAHTALARGKYRLSAEHATGSGLWATDAQQTHTHIREGAHLEFCFLTKHSRSVQFGIPPLPLSTSSSTQTSLQTCPELYGSRATPGLTSRTTRRTLPPYHSETITAAIDIAIGITAAPAASTA